MESINSKDSDKLNDPSKIGRWTEEEHERFLQGLRLYGREWKKVAEKVQTRTAAQIRSHAQKYFAKIHKETPDLIKDSHLSNPAVNNNYVWSNSKYPVSSSFYPTEGVYYPEGYNTIGVNPQTRKATYPSNTYSYEVEIINNMRKRDEIIQQTSKTRDKTPIIPILTKIDNTIYSCYCTVFNLSSMASQDKIKLYSKITECMNNQPTSILTVFISTFSPKIGEYLEVCRNTSNYLSPNSTPVSITPLQRVSQPSGLSQTSLYSMDSDKIPTRQIVKSPVLSVSSHQDTVNKSKNKTTQLNDDEMKIVKTLQELSKSPKVTEETVSSKVKPSKENKSKISHKKEIDNSVKDTNAHETHSTDKNFSEKNLSETVTSEPSNSVISTSPVEVQNSDSATPTEAKSDSKPAVSSVKEEVLSTDKKPVEKKGDDLQTDTKSSELELKEDSSISGSTETDTPRPHKEEEDLKSLSKASKKSPSEQQSLKNTTSVPDKSMKQDLYASSGHVSSNHKRSSTITSALYKEKRIKDSIPITYKNIPLSSSTTVTTPTSLSPTPTYIPAVAPSLGMSTTTVPANYSYPVSDVRMYSPMASNVPTERTQLYPPYYTIPVQTSVSSENPLLQSLPSSFSKSTPNPYLYMPQVQSDYIAVTNRSPLVTNAATTAAYHNTTPSTLYSGEYPYSVYASYRSPQGPVDMSTANAQSRAFGASSIPVTNTVPIQGAYPNPYTQGRYEQIYSIPR